MSEIFKVIEKGVKNGKIAVLRISGEVKDANREIFEQKVAKAALNDKYYELGAIVYQSYKAYHDPSEYNPFQQQLKEIDTLVEKIEELEVAINTRLGITICPTCGTKTRAENNYCPACGKQLLSGIEEVIPGLCKECGTQNPEENKFCGNCGNKLTE